ncbi:MAG: SAM-dependent methyltransferase [Casimicrobiaceae bacterium]|nr:SAM-dependent methyltransferase [Casimicrobiaceae bacterium]
MSCASVEGKQICAMREPDPAQQTALAEHRTRMYAHLAACARTRAYESSAEADAGRLRLPFVDFMNAALYAPGLGYYTGTLPKLGAQADFVTAPELTPLFGRTLVRGLEPLRARAVLELGAGSGALAEAMLEACPGLDYRILEVSASLEARQRRRLHGRGVRWLRALPQRIEGVLLANELLDALPCELLRYRHGRYERAFVVLEDGVQCYGLEWERLEEETPLAHLARERVPAIEGYTSELNLHAEALVRTVAERLHEGVAVFIDYGFPRREYYLPERSMGTLACHRAQRVHFDPLAAPGLEDLTAHVDFTAMAEAAVEGGCRILCYAPQGLLLLAFGLVSVLEEALERAGSDARARAQALAAVQRLTAPSEMGELYKVLIIGRGAAAERFAEALASIDQSFRL